MLAQEFPLSVQYETRCQSMLDLWEECLESLYVLCHFQITPGRSRMADHDFFGYSTLIGKLEIPGEERLFHIWTQCTCLLMDVMGGLYYTAGPPSKSVLQGSASVVSSLQSVQKSASPIAFRTAQTPPLCFCRTHSLYWAENPDLQKTSCQSLIEQFVQIIQSHKRAHLPCLIFCSVPVVSQL